ncbi:MAG: hypothetical protein R3B53_04295 [Candidatus Paceibacterota bacterium]
MNFEHIANDLDTPAALALLWQVTKDDELDNATKCATIHVMDSILDLGLRDNVTEGVKKLGILMADEIPEEILKLVEQREAARIARNWPEADTYREALNLKGYSVEDLLTALKSVNLTLNLTNFLIHRVHSTV